MIRSASVLLLCLFAASPALAQKPAPAAAKKPQVLAVDRPLGGEWMGVYVLGKKAGFAFSDLVEAKYEGRPAILAKSHLTLRAVVGGAKTERTVDEERYYEAKDGGRLLYFRVEFGGDGGAQTLIGRCTPEGIALTRKRPGLPDEQRKLPATDERVELADPVRIAIATGRKVEGMSLDTMEKLKDERSVTEVVGEETLTL
ncbi:MAG: transglutaminase domain-containing protein, partial [Myxococcales bacterium]